MYVLDMQFDLSCCRAEVYERGLSPLLDPDTHLGTPDSGRLCVVSHPLARSPSKCLSFFQFALLNDDPILIGAIECFSRMQKVMYCE